MEHTPTSTERMVQSLDELNLSAARGVAVSEMQSMGGPADYILFVDIKALGVVEAKKTGTTLSGVAEQSSRYTHARLKHFPELKTKDLRDCQIDANTGLDRQSILRNALSGSF